MKRSAVVIGSGPNGLAAAVRLAQAGLHVEVLEAEPTVGGATRSLPLTIPGFVHDFGSAVHPMARSSPFFSSLPLEDFGLRWVYPSAQLAHPFDDGTAALVERDVRSTAAQLGGDAHAYSSLFEPLARTWHELAQDILSPVLRIPRHPLLMASFGLKAIQSCRTLVESRFRGDRARALVAGSAAHSTLSMETPVSGGFGLILTTTAHAVGWPVAEGGSQKIADALTRYLEWLGGRVVTGVRVDHLRELGAPDLILCDVTPRGFLHLTRGLLRRPFQKLLERYRYGPGVFKMDWALSEPIPWKAQECRRSATVHLAGSFEEISTSERDAIEGRPPEKPFVLLTQPTLFDKTRAPEGKHTAWAYCHVPNAWSGSAQDAMEKQIERFAPGFRDCILARRSHNSHQMQANDQNLVGGDINGGLLDLAQFALRPTWRRYGTPLKGVYLCSSSTPPGGAVHGMCGFWAAEWALKSLRERT
jgi:phytoene dehydrogenase-like protein